MKNKEQPQSISGFAQDGALPSSSLISSIKGSSQTSQESNQNSKSSEKK